MAEPDHYRTLGVAPDAEPAVVRAAYRALMLEYHPDRNQTPHAEARARAINAAFFVLRDPERRRRFDFERLAAIRAQTPRPTGGAKPRSAPPPRPRPPAPRRPVRASPLALFRTGSKRKVVTVAGVAGALGIAALLRYTSIALVPAGLFTPSHAIASAPGGPVEPTATDGSPPAVSPTALGDAALRYADFYKGKRFTDARNYSVDCHRTVAAKPTWDSADRCAAFDLAASVFADATSRSYDKPEDPYFLDEVDPSTLYKGLTSDAFLLSLRLDHIRQAIVPAAVEAVWPNGDHDGSPELASSHDASQPSGRNQGKAPTTLTLSGALATNRQQPSNVLPLPPQTFTPETDPVEAPAEP